MDQSLELKLAVIACIGLSGVYVVYEIASEPSGGHSFGLALGIVGTVLMVFTETAYSARKRLRWLRGAGPVRWWLSVHIFAGIVGPFLVLMHTGLQFRGLAGVTMGLTVLVVASGFFGRYLFQAIPRTLGGAEATATELESELAAVRAALAELARARSAAVRELVEAEARTALNFSSGAWAVLTRAWDEWQYRRGLRRRIQQLEHAERRGLGDVERLLSRRRRLDRQARSLAAAQRLFGLWHLAHVPMGLTLFGSVAIHVIAALYFGAGQ